MEKETSSLVSLGIVLIAIAVVITLGFAIFAVGKRLANSGQNDLVSQVDQISQSTFTDLDQQVITGTRLKGVINQLSSGNYAVLLNTLALRNCYLDSAKVNGDLQSSPDSYKKAIVNTNYPSTSSKGTAAKNTFFVNYNALLGDADPTYNKLTYGVKDGKIKNTADTDLKGVPTTADDIALNSTKHLIMKDGVFTTQYEFKTDSIGNVSKNIRQSDFNKQGSTMFIADAAQFNSYCIKDSTDNYVGLAFVQVQK